MCRSGIEDRRHSKVAGELESVLDDGDRKLKLRHENFRVCNRVLGAIHVSGCQMKTSSRNDDDGVLALEFVDNDRRSAGGVIGRLEDELAIDPLLRISS